MSLINEVLFYARLLLIVFIIIGIVMVGLLYYLIKIKKIAAKEENVDYSTFRRSDPKSYVKFDTIISDTPDTLKSAGIIVLGGNTFVAGLDVTMSDDYATTSPGGRQQIMSAAITFWNSVTEPVQMRQSVQAIDMSDTIERYEQKLLKLSEEGMMLQEDYDETVHEAELHQDDPEETAAYERKIRELQHRISAKKHAVDETKELLKYSRLMSGNKEAQKVHQFIYSYTYNPDDFTTELTKEEIYLRAISELKLKGQIFTEAYAACGCRCKRISGSNLIMLMRKHLHPYYTDDVSMEDIFNSSYNSLFVTSDSLVELEKEKIGEEEYRQHMEELYAQYNERQKKLQEESEKEREKLLKEAKVKARAQLQEAY